MCLDIPGAFKSMPRLKEFGFLTSVENRICCQFNFNFFGVDNFQQAPEAGGCATGDGGDRRDRRRPGDMGERGDMGTGLTLRHDFSEIKPKMSEISSS